MQTAQETYPPIVNLNDVCERFDEIFKWNKNTQSTIPDLPSKNSIPSPEQAEITFINRCNKKQRLMKFILASSSVFIG
jgi:hypothetical protein